MRIRIYFVRHAEAQTNSNPLFVGGEDNLTEIGSQQASLLGKRFIDIPVEAIYSSKILRAQLTAKEIEKVIGVKSTTLEYLKERKGSYSTDKVFNAHESFEELKSRLEETKKFLENLSQKHVVVVSHAIFIKSMAAYLMLGNQLTEDLLLKMESVLTMNNVAISMFVYNQEKSKWHMESWNDQVHLS